MGKGRELCIDSSEIYAKFEKNTRKIFSLNQLLKKIGPWIDKENKVIRRNIKKYRDDVILGEKKAEELIMDIICKDNTCYLKNASIDFIDRRSLWLMINEILLDEDYYIEYDNEQPIIFDCGANIGLATYYFKTLYPKAKIICFEPWEEAYQILRKNIEINGWSDVTVYPYALSDKNGFVQFNVPNDNSLAGTLTERCFENPKDGLQVDSKIVEIKKLSEFIVEPIDFLKLDIEGVEKKVLYEIEPMLSEVKYLYCEYHYGKLVNDNSLADIISLLEKNGFVYEISKSNAFQKHTKTKPMLHVGKKVSMILWAKKVS